MQVPKYLLFIAIAWVMELLTLNSTIKYYNAAGKGFNSMWLFPIFWLVVLTGEIIYYFINRDKITKHADARKHCQLMFVAFIMLPVFNLILKLAAPHLTDAQFDELLYWYNNIKLYGLTILIVMAHYFFVRVVRQVYKEPKKQ
ncbi:hypothetical protein [Polluticaenibacter yanchengensis]|uniref:Uncharacterized protein n=1 Tax=Polluticaenibacter yanchengensis TaxID=3014562 RepID=A0ABT4UHN3_9BACT|nr:hypothetical protein [Chitinophagaceae bacterium LY-5]